MSGNFSDLLQLRADAISLGTRLGTAYLPESPWLEAKDYSSAIHRCVTPSEGHARLSGQQRLAIEKLFAPEGLLHLLAKANDWEPHYLAILDRLPTAIAKAFGETLISRIRWQFFEKPRLLSAVSNAPEPVQLPSTVYLRIDDSSEWISSDSLPARLHSLLIDLPEFPPDVLSEVRAACEWHLDRANSTLPEAVTALARPFQVTSDYHSLYARTSVPPHWKRIVPKYIQLMSRSGSDSFGTDLLYVCRRSHERYTVFTEHIF